MMYGKCTHSTNGTFSCQEDDSPETFADSPGGPVARFMKNGKEVYNINLQPSYSRSDFLDKLKPDWGTVTFSCPVSKTEPVMPVWQSPAQVSSRISPAQSSQRETAFQQFLDAYIIEPVSGRVEINWKPVMPDVIFNALTELFGPKLLDGNFAAGFMSGKITFDKSDGSHGVVEQNRYNNPKNLYINGPLNSIMFSEAIIGNLYPSPGNQVQVVKVDNMQPVQATLQFYVKRRYFKYSIN